jgi:hypothetical protein
VIGGVDVVGVLPTSWRGVGVAAGVSPGDHSLVRMDGEVAGVALANMAVMNPGGTERDEVGEQSCVGAISWICFMCRFTHFSLYLDYIKISTRSYKSGRREYKNLNPLVRTSFSVS